MTRAFYLFDGLFPKNKGQLGRDYEHIFASPEDAKNAPIPGGIAKVLIFVEAGCYVYSSRFSGFGWEFYEKSSNRASL
jgi:hypothetical protein